MLPMSGLGLTSTSRSTVNTLSVPWPGISATFLQALEVISTQMPFPEVSLFKQTSFRRLT